MTAPDRFKLYQNPRARRPPREDSDTTFASTDAVQTVRRFHHSMPMYRPTPLVSLKQLAHRLGLGSIWVKDESQRLDLKAFKGLGASYAVCATLAQRLKLPGPLKFDLFRQPRIQDALSDITLVAASDGNHGTAVAWMANQIGCHSLIFLPGGTADKRVRAIQEMGGQAVIAEGNYDHAVRRAARESDRKNHILIQDTAWEGYETVPQYVMQGYLTLLDEAFEQVGRNQPTHILVPCGVGAFAAALQAYLVEKFADRRPILIVIEAAAADCYFRSMVAGGQKIIPVTGDLTTRMAGLACGEPTRPGWKILRQYADGFASCGDNLAVKGMQALAFPTPPDPSIESGECGAVTLGCLLRLMRPDSNSEDRADLGLGAASRIMLISTEGATDPHSYRQAIHGFSESIASGD